MSSTSKAWSVAASIGAVEALKDQGVCRWNNTFRSAQQHLKFTSLSQANKISSSFSAMGSIRLKDDQTKPSEESLRTFMYLCCWGPN